MSTTISIKLEPNSNVNYCLEFIKAINLRSTVNLSITGLETWDLPNAKKLIAVLK